MILIFFARNGNVNDGDCDGNDNGNGNGLSGYFVAEHTRSLFLFHSSSMIPSCSVLDMIDTWMAP